MVAGAGAGGGLLRGEDSVYTRERGGDVCVCDVHHPSSVCEGG